MTKSNLPQKYHEVAKALIPYVSSEEGSSGQMALIKVDPALPCFICSQPATEALIAPSSKLSPGSSGAWLTFPICEACEERQVQSQHPHSE